MANAEDFKKLFDDIVIKAKATSKLEKDEVSRFCNFMIKIKGKVFQNYEIIRDEVKEKYMINKKNDLDRHKIAACLIASVMKTGLKDPYIKNREISLGLLAVKLGQAVLLSFAKDEIKECPEWFEFLKKNGGLKYPENLHDERGYLQNWASELCFAQRDEMLFVLSISNTLFLLESYNQRVFMQEIMEKKFSKLSDEIVSIKNALKEQGLIQ